MKIQVGDTVKVISGRDNGVVGKVLSVDHKKNRLVVEGANKVYKHVRPSQRNPQGGRLEKEMPMDASNVMVVCPKTNQPTRIGYRYASDGSKERFARKSGVALNTISKPNEKYAN